MENMMNLPAIPKYVPNGCVELITPEIAKQQLAQHNNLNPRKRINPNTVKVYAIDMKAGKWHLNGEPIVIDANGNIKNGQHRLMAIIAANVPVYCFVVRGIDPEISTFDMPLTRRVRQELGVSTSSESLAKMVVTNCYKLGQTPKGMLKDYIVGHFTEINQALNISIHGGNSKRGVITGNRRDVYGAIYLMTRCGTNPDEIKSFMKVVNSGFMLDDRESSSAIVLANFLRSNSTAGKNRVKILVSLQFVVKAFHDFENGIARRISYRINNTSEVEDMLQRVRVEDGLEGGYDE